MFREKLLILTNYIKCIFIPNKKILATNTILKMHWLILFKDLKKCFVQ